MVTELPKTKKKDSYNFLIKVAFLDSLGDRKPKVLEVK